MFEQKIKNKESGILLYGITPPKAHNTGEKILDISQKTIARVQKLGIDGLVIYDLQDESARNPEERPFPFFQTLDADLYNADYLLGLNIPKIIYRSVGKYSKETLISRIAGCSEPTVFVGVPSSAASVTLKLSDAYSIWNRNNKNGCLGGVTIPERHHAHEHLRIINKMNQGCSFFISQCVYNVEIVKNMLSDLFFHCSKAGIPVPTIIFTLTTCGSEKTLDFLSWLGINVPQWLKNELHHCDDMLTKSVDLSLEIANEIKQFCEAKAIPYGFNIESVSIRKVEIEASEYLLEGVKKLLSNEVPVKKETAV